MTAFTDEFGFDDELCIGAPDCFSSLSYNGKHTKACDDAMENRYGTDWLIDEIEKSLKDSKVSTTTSSTTAMYLSKCCHVQREFVLSDGTPMHGSTHHYREPEDPTVDLGVYLDGCWKPDTIAFHVGWKDYGLPLPSRDQILVVIDEALAVARDGKQVEVGCIGGHGRTGSMLALMDLCTMDNPDADLAISRVRTLYCDHAIETREQEWYIEAWAAWLRGEEIPAKPTPPPKVEIVAASKPVEDKPKAKGKHRNKKKSKKARYVNRKRKR